MRKGFRFNEQCCNVKTSSDSEQYTLDHLDLLNLKISFSSDASRHKLSERKSASRDRGGDGYHNRHQHHSGQRLKHRRRRTDDEGVGDNNSGEASPTTSVTKRNPCKGYFKVSNESQEDERSVFLLYSNKLNRKSDSPTKTASEEFLTPARSRRDKFLKPESNDVMTVSEFSAKDRKFEPRPSKERNFPFKVTPSGNLKVNSQQVVFESQKLSVLVANPETTQVDISDEMSHKREGEPSQEMAMNHIINHGLDTSLGSLLVGRLANAPQKMEMESSEYEGKPTNEILDPEINLSRLGYNAHDSIDWNEVVLPEKKNLYLELYSRITNFTNADCKVYIDNEEFSCHLIVLQCYSEVFHTYVAVKKVELPSDKCSASSFAFIYEWMITGDPSYKELNRENVLDIFNAAKYLKIRDLVEQCWAFIDNPEVFNEDTAFLLYVDAKEKNLAEVRELMLPRIQKFFLMLVSSQDWLELDLEDVQNFLQSNYVSVNCEMEIFMSAIRWLKHSADVRAQYKVAVLSCVRFGNIAPWQLVDIKRNPDNPDFREMARDPEICKMIDDGLAFVIIKYWYGQENENYQHWNSILALKEPPERNWSGSDKTYFTYREFLIYLDKYRRSQMMEKSHSKDRKKKVCESLPSQASSTEKLPPKMPTMDEFLSSGKATSSQQPKKACSRFSKSTSPSSSRSPRSPRTRRLKRLSRDQAARIIQAAYRRYRHRMLILARYHKCPSPKKKPSPRRGTQEFPWKPNPKIVNMFKKMEDLETKYAQMYCAKSGKQINCLLHPTDSRQKSSDKDALKSQGQFNETSLFIFDRESVLVFGGIDPHSDFGIGRNNGKDVYRFVADRNQWEHIGQMPEPRHHHCVAFLKGKVFIVGGADPREEDSKGKTIVVDTVWSFDPFTRTWKKEPSLTYKRKNFGLVVSEKHLFAIGGQGAQGRTLATVEKMTVNGGTWEKCSSMLYSRMGVACAKFEEKIWAAGGMSGSKRQPLPNSVECYDIDKNQWTEISKLRHPRCFGTLFAMANKLYLIGGAGRIHTKDKTTTSLASIDLWNAASKEWEKISEMTIPRHGHAIAYLGTQILIIGGVTTIYMRALSNIECFCGSRGSWIRGIAPLPTYLSGHAAITLPPGRLV